MSGQGTYVFKKGADFEKVAKEWSFKSPKPIWEDPGNSKLKRARKTWDKLQAGDKVFMPYTDKMKAEILKKQIHYLELIEGEKALATVCVADAKAAGAAGDFAIKRIKEIDKARADLEKMLKGTAKDIKDTKFVVDTVWEVTKLLVGLGGKSAKASKASGEALKKINQEAQKMVTDKVKDKAEGAAKSAGLKWSRTKDGPVATVMSTLLILDEANSNMNSPAFWFSVIAHMKASGKGVTWESWSEAVTFDMDQEITNRLNIADRTFVPARKAALREAQAAVKSATELTRLGKAAMDRVKIHQKKFDALPKV